MTKTRGQSNSSPAFACPPLSPRLRPPRQKRRLPRTSSWPGALHCSRAPRRTQTHCLLQTGLGAL